MQDAVVTQPRPDRAQLEPAVLSLLSRHSAGLLATARRYSVSPEDAEDAYQRGVEILLTKAPTTREDELLPWLKTVVKHEAFAVRESNGRATPADDPIGGRADPEAWTEERAERYERLRVGAEALANLKPQEVRCLLLRAEGLSYKEICEITQWSYTKVNRCITEGRRAFTRRIASIESGAECERLQPLISKAADGEASAAEMRMLRPHVRSCLACKATLREYRAAPSRLAALVPPVVAAAGAPGSGLGGFVLRIVAAVQDRIALLADGPAAQKAAAVAASALVLAGGGAAGVQAVGDRAGHGDGVHPQQAVTTSANVPATAPAPNAAASPSTASGAGSPADSPRFATAPSSEPSTTTTTSSTAKPSPQQPAEGEFDPGTPASDPAPAPAPPSSAAPAPGSAPSPGSAPATSGGGEFVP